MFLPSAHRSEDWSCPRLNTSSGDRYSTWRKRRNRSKRRNRRKQEKQNDKWKKENENKCEKELQEEDEGI